jgi:hypothetical protein
MLARSPMFLAVAALVSGSGALAMGFGRAPSSVLLGSPLNYAVPVRMDAGESITNECVFAEVQIGDRRLLPGDTRIAVEPGVGPDDRVLRVTTSQPVDEPVVSVTVTVGCGARSARRFTAFADPPTMQVAPPVVAAPDPPVQAPAQAADPSGTAAASASPVASPAPPVVRNVPLRRVQAERRVPRERAVTARPTRVARSAAERPVRVSPPQDPVVAKMAPAVTRPRAEAAETPRVVPLGAARLRLEAADPEYFPPPSAAAAASQPALTPIFSGNPLAEELTASQAARMRALEASVEQLRAESKASRELMQQMRSRVSEGEFNSRLVPWLGAALALMGGLALWLTLRLRRMQSQAQGQWWVSAAAPLDDSAPESQTAAVAPPPAVSKPAVAMPAATPAAPASAAPTLPSVVARLTETDSATAGGATVLPAHAEESVPGRSPRDVAIDELIDLEQQADFFVVLGQDDAAIDLLLGHIRSSGGQSPMPYMKLLEIYRRTGDREAYDRLREKFNLRFNAIAPEWDADLRAGRSIEEYPAEFERISGVWNRPLDALAELEALLFRREGGQAFELPAYRDLLFLYAMARDHLEDVTGAASAVDLLLPLGEATGDHTAGAGGATLTGPDWENPKSVEITSSSEFSTLDLDLATRPMPDSPADQAEAPAARLLDVDLELRLDDPAPAPGASGTSRR